MHQGLRKPPYPMHLDKNLAYNHTHGRAGWEPSGRALWKREQENDDAVYALWLAVLPYHEQPSACFGRVKTRSLHALWNPPQKPVPVRSAIPEAQNPHTGQEATFIATSTGRAPQGEPGTCKPGCYRPCTDMAEVVRRAIVDPNFDPTHQHMNWARVVASGKSSGLVSLG